MTDTSKFEGIFDDDPTREVISYALENEIGLIANSKVFSNLENLSIEYHEIGNRVIEDIFNSSVLKNLKTLSLEGNSEFNNFGIASSGTSNLSNLRELSLMWEVIRLKDLELMKENRLFVNLTKLIISGVSMLPEETFSSAITDPVWLNLKELHLNTQVSTNVSKIKCALQLEKLTVEVSDIEACKALADNKTISQSLKYLNVGRINVNQENLKDTVTLIRIGEQFEKVSSFNIRKLNNPNPKGQNWVVLVAGSNGYFNYRHQADICHAYKIVTDRGIPASNIITFMFDDIAFNQDNPQKGIIINEYNGTNVYPGKEAIDYRGEDVTPEVFLSVLRGETNITRGNGKTLKSGPNDRIFIYFADHGATNILAFPGFNVLHSQDLLDTLQYMYKKRMYSQLLFYVEACESGSMFNSILNANLNVYAETASTPFESSYACDYSNDVNAYLNDCYSINWMNDTDFCDVRKETIAEQFDNVLKETTTSHVCKYGDMSFEDETLIYFQGNVTTYKETKPRRKVNNPIRKPLNSRFVYEDYLIKRMTKAKLESSMPTFIKYETEYQTFLKKKARTDFIFSQLSSKFNLGTLQKYRRQFIEDMMRVNPSKTCYSDEQADLRCVKTHIQIFEKVCGKFDEYSIQFASHLKDTCLMNVKSEDLYQFLKQTC